MTKNKSLFSGVGDGNRVKSIRLQGDKHTQGKKGEKKNCECGPGGSKPRAPANPPGLGRGGGARKEVQGQRDGESPGTSGPAVKPNHSLGS